ncbi:hypothetical protein SYK_12090 [Pseudodesulfovibrio nedwellii]|uniref:Uncharacterized protein n=1 Tax=Pseudodesulfovibrio nedwellii TaxID=2973072 RepID=A0ABM8AZE3_9BACT|nr:hypothetical protein SYK_12090 [Pseudodesulfovibrio nedwellii]
MSFHPVVIRYVDAVILQNGKESRGVKILLVNDECFGETIDIVTDYLSGT